MSEDKLGAADYSSMQRRLTKESSRVSISTTTVQHARLSDWPQTAFIPIQKSRSNLDFALILACMSLHPLPALILPIVIHHCLLGCSRREVRLQSESR